MSETPQTITFYADDPEAREADLRAALADPETKVVIIPADVPRDEDGEPILEAGQLVKVTTIGELGWTSR